MHKYLLSSSMKLWSKSLVLSFLTLFSAPSISSRPIILHQTSPIDPISVHLSESSPTVSGSILFDKFRFDDVGQLLMTSIDAQIVNKYDLNWYRESSQGFIIFKTDAQVNLTSIGGSIEDLSDVEYVDSWDCSYSQCTGPQNFSYAEMTSFTRSFLPGGIGGDIPVTYGWSATESNASVLPSHNDIYISGLVKYTYAIRETLI